MQQSFVLPMNHPPKNFTHGILLVDKAKRKSSFSIVSSLRKITKIQKIGHVGTLDPFATGLMVILIGKDYTTKAKQFLNLDKEYIATLHLGKVSETFDDESEIQEFSTIIPKKSDIDRALLDFNGVIFQTPPMYSAKKINGQKLYHLARKGITIKRDPIEVELCTSIISYEYPLLKLKISCSKGTYIRTLAHDLGQKLLCGAYLLDLMRTRLGKFLLEDALSQHLFDTSINSNLDSKTSLELIEKKIFLC